MKAMETDFSKSLLFISKTLPFFLSLLLFALLGAGLCERESMGEDAHRIGISICWVDFCVSCEAHRFG